MVFTIGKSIKKLNYFYTQKNNATTILVRKGSSVSKGITFYLLTGMFLIALVEKLMPEIYMAGAVFSSRQIIIKNGMASAFSLEQLLLVFWQIKMILLLGILVLWVLKMALP